MLFLESETALENSLIETLVGVGYNQVSIASEEELINNFRVQINKHNLAKHLNNIPLTDTEFERLMISIGGKGIFNSA